MKTCLVLWLVISIAAVFNAQESEQVLKKEVVIRPSDIAFIIRRQAFKDTVLKLDSSKNIRLTIKVRNSQFLPMFAF